MEPTLKTNTYERGTYYFFDCLNWRKVAKVTGPPLHLQIGLSLSLSFSVHTATPRLIPGLLRNTDAAERTWSSGVVSNICFPLCFKEFHLEYDKLEERPQVPTTFNYNPAQQAF